jgi:N-acetyl sugar amidotransferase
MDTTHEDISFDAAGLCNFCRGYEASRKQLLPEPEARKVLGRIISRMKTDGRNKEYDCILGVSGGVDSSYLALKLKEFGLRTLAVEFDNGWNSELAVKNIELLCKKLEMDLFTYVVDWEEFRDLQLSFLKASVANVEAPSDHAIFATLYQTASRRGIKYIVNGNNIVTEGIGSISYGYDFRDLTHILAVHRRFGSVPLKTFPQMGFIKIQYYLKVRGIKPVSLLNYMPYNKGEAIRTLEEKLGWRYYGGKHYESIITRFHQAYILPTKFKVDKRRAHLSNLICSGQMTRSDALSELEQTCCPAELLAQDYAFVVKKLGLTNEQFDALISALPKSYQDYPNVQWLYRLYAWAGHRRAAVTQGHQAA